MSSQSQIHPYWMRSAFQPAYEAAMLSGHWPSVQLGAIERRSLQLTAYARDRQGSSPMVGRSRRSALPDRDRAESQVFLSSLRVRITATGRARISGSPVMIGAFSTRPVATAKASA